jgi:hypothetical protein
MLTWIRSHLGVVAVAAVALLVVGTSSATATLVITGKDIKNNTVTTKDVKNGTLKAEDLSKPVRDALQASPSVAGFIGSACTVPGGGAGTVAMQVAANGTATLICSVAAAPAQNADVDADGYLRSQECNDTLAAVHPGATEVNGNRIDDDCDGQADDGSSTADDDADLFSIMQGDCDDTNPAAHPGGTDAFGNGLDEDCDGVDG